MFTNGKLLKSSLVLYMPLIIALSPALADATEYFPYERFIELVESGKVESVQLDKLSQIEGTFTDERIEKNFHTYAATGSSNDTLLLRFLEENNVPVQHKDAKESDSDIYILLLLLLAILPLILLVVLIVIIVKINRKLNLIIANQQNDSSLAGQTE